MLLWRALRTGYKLQLSIPPTLVSASKDTQRAFLYTNERGAVDIVEGREAVKAFFSSLPKRKHRHPIAIHHTRIQAASLYFSRKSAKAALKATTLPYHYIQQYVTNRTHTPELLCSVFRPEKPIKFYLIVARHSEDLSHSQPRHNSLPNTKHEWTLDRNDHSKSEILECSQGDAAVAAMSEHLYELLGQFGLGEVTELVTDYVRNKESAWIFNSLVSISLEGGRKAKVVRPRTASAEVKPLSLKAKVIPTASKPQSKSFLRLSVMTASSAMLERVTKDNSRGAKLKSHISSSSLLDIETRLRNIQISHPPHLRLEATTGDQSFPSLSSLIPACQTKPSPIVKHVPSQYESLMAKELNNVSAQYDDMRRMIREFHDRKANPKRCIYYYPDCFWKDVTAFVTKQMTSDLKAFPMFNRVEVGHINTLVGEFLTGMRKEVLPNPIPMPLLELAVELSIPRMDPNAFISILHAAFQACRMRNDEVEIATEVYRENLATLMRFNWKKSFTTFLTKRIMSEEFLSKVMKLQEATSPLLRRTQTTALERKRKEET
jgi:hypothetical protein